MNISTHKTGTTRLLIQFNETILRINVETSPYRQKAADQITAYLLTDCNPKAPVWRSIFPPGRRLDNSIVQVLLAVPEPAQQFTAK
jgi:hypothetical protein